MIALENVTAGYGGKQVLTNLTLTLAEHGVTALTGPSGEGKTTVLRLLAGLERPWSGTVHRPKNPSILFQEDRLFPWRTVEQHLQDVLPRPRWTEIPTWLSLAELQEEKDTLPAALSGGMARRLALTRALALGGDCLLLDEPFTGIDIERRSIFLELLAHWPTPVLLITHQFEETRIAQRILRL